MNAYTQQAYEAGYQAAVNGKPRAPATSKVVNDIIAKLSTTDFANHNQIMDVMGGFIKGYEKQVSEECDKLLESA
jgi:hypothetical protein